MSLVSAFPGCRNGFAALLALALTAVSGCSSLPGSQERWKQFQNAPESEERQAQRLMRLLQYGSAVPTLSEPDLRWEYIQLKPAEDPSADLADRLKLAVFLSTAPAPFRNDSQAEILLREYLQSSDSQGQAPSRELAGLLLHFVQDRLNDQRSQESQLQQHSRAIADARRALAEERKHRAELEEKLEALLTIEKSLTERDERSPTTP